MDSVLDLERVRFANEYGREAIYVRDQRVSVDDDAERLRCVTFALEIDSMGPGRKVAVLGGGVCTLPRLLGFHAVTVFEIERGIAEEMAKRYPFRWGWVVGDYRTEILGRRYDVIVYDVSPDEPEGPPLAMLESCLFDGGRLLGVSGR